jgi:hypothetical protein
MDGKPTPALTLGSLADATVPLTSIHTHTTLDGAA